MTKKLCVLGTILMMLGPGLAISQMQDWEDSNRSKASGGVFKDYWDFLTMYHSGLLEMEDGIMMVGLDEQTFKTGQAYAGGGFFPGLIGPFDFYLAKSLEFDSTPFAPNNEGARSQESGWNGTSFDITQTQTLTASQTMDARHAFMLKVGVAGTFGNLFIAPGLNFGLAGESINKAYTNDETTRDVSLPAAEELVVDVDEEQTVLVDSKTLRMGLDAGLATVGGPFSADAWFNYDLIGLQGLTVSGMDTTYPISGPNVANRDTENIGSINVGLFGDVLGFGLAPVNLVGFGAAPGTFDTNYTIDFSNVLPAGAGVNLFSADVESHELPGSAITAAVDLYYDLPFLGGFSAYAGGHYYLRTLGTSPHVAVVQADDYDETTATASQFLQTRSIDTDTFTLTNDGISSISAKLGAKKHAMPMDGLMIGIDLGYELFLDSFGISGTRTRTRENYSDATPDGSPDTHTILAENFGGYSVAATRTVHDFHITSTIKKMMGPMFELIVGGTWRLTSDTSSTTTVDNSGILVSDTTEDIVAGTPAPAVTLTGNALAYAATTQSKALTSDIIAHWGGRLKVEGIAEANFRFQANFGAGSDVFEMMQFSVDITVYTDALMGN